MVTTPLPRRSELAKLLEEMSPDARRLLTEDARWWPHDDGSVAFRLPVAKEDMEALHELSDVLLCVGFEVESRRLGAEEVLPVPEGDGLTSAELGSLLDERRHLPRNEYDRAEGDRQVDGPTSFRLPGHGR
jgi:hypothetical protein